MSDDKLIDMTSLNRGAEELQRLSGSAPHPSTGGGGDGGSMLELRVKRLEEDVSELRSDMKAVRGDLNDLKVGLASIEVKIAGVDGKVTGVEGRLGGLPTWSNLMALAGMMVGAVGVMIAVATYILRLSG